MSMTELTLPLETYRKAHPDNLSKRSLQRHILGRMMRHPHKTEPYTVVCLPGRKCWEIEYLSQFDHRVYTGTGPGVKKIIALEQDEEVFKIIKDKTRDNDLVEVMGVDTTTFLNSYRGSVDLVYFDYYSYFSSRVVQDMEIMLERRVLSEGGKCIVNFLAARESTSDQIRQERLFYKFTSAVDFQLDWGSLDADRRRCVAFNALIGRYRYKSIDDKDYSREERKYVATTAPLWHRYKTLMGQSMLTGYFTLNAYKPRQSRQAIKVALPLWTVNERWSVTDWECSFSVDKEENYEYYKELVQRFYAEHHYTPTPHDLGRTILKVLPRVVEELGLCPRATQLRTADHVKREIDRIYKRCGVVTVYSLLKAKIPYRTSKAVKFKISEIISYCEESSYPHRLNLRMIQQLTRDRLLIISYLERLQQGGSGYRKDDKKKFYRLLGGEPTFMSALNLKVKIEREFSRLRLTKEGRPAVEYTDEQIAKMYRQGVSIKALADLRLISHSMMVRHLKGLGLDVRHRNLRLRENLTSEKAARDFEALGSIIKVAKKYSVNTKLISRLLSEEGVSPKRSGGYIDIDTDALTQDYLSGLEVSELMEKYEVSRTVVHLRLNEQGIKKRTPKRKVELPMGEIVEDYRLGLPLSKIALKHDVSSATIRGRLLEQGIELNRPGRGWEVK